MQATHGVRHAEGAIAAGALAGYSGHKTGEAVGQAFQGHGKLALAHAATAVVARHASTAISKRVDPTKLNKALFTTSAIATSILSSQGGRSAVKYGLRGAAHGFRKPSANIHYTGQHAGPFKPPSGKIYNAPKGSYKFSEYRGKAKGELTGKPIIQIAMEMKKHLALKRAGKPAQPVAPLKASFQLPVKRHKPVPPAPPAGPSTVMHVHNHFGPRPKLPLKAAGTTKHSVKRPVTKKGIDPAPDQSFSDFQSEIGQSFRNQFPDQPSVTADSPMKQESGTYRYISDTFRDYVIVCENGKYYKVGYTDTGTDDTETGKDITFAPRKKWSEVARKMTTTWESKEIAAQAFIFKEADDYRWVLLSSNGFRDRDGEILSTKALQRDVALWDLEGAPEQPLRWWHVALTKDYSRGVEVGSTDYRAVAGHTLIESGTFIDPLVGEAVFKAQDKLAASVGFRHSQNQPNADKIFDAVNIFERSLLPKGKQSNVLVELMVN